MRSPSKCFRLHSDDEELSNLVEVTVVLEGLRLVYNKLEHDTALHGHPNSQLILQAMATWGARLRAEQEQRLHAMLDRNSLEERNDETIPQ